MTLLLLVLAACGDSSGPTVDVMAGTWALESVNDSTLPHSFTDTVPIPDGDPVIFTTVVVADTLILRDGNPSERRTWLGDPSPFTVGLTWSLTGPGDSVTVTELFNAGLEEHHGVLRGDRLTVRNATLVRPGLYAYTRVTP